MKAFIAGCASFFRTSTPPQRGRRSGLTHAGIEVEGVTEVGKGTEGVLIVGVTAIRPHPSKTPALSPSRARGGEDAEVVRRAERAGAGRLVKVLELLGVHLPAKGSPSRRARSAA